MRAILAALLLCACSSAAVRAEDCIASVYGVHDSDQTGTVTASGIPLDDRVATIAMKKPTPLRSRVRVTNLRTGASAVFQVTDRGPYVRGRCVDLSHAAARAIGINGLGAVRVSRP